MLKIITQLCMFLVGTLAPTPDPDPVAEISQAVCTNAAQCVDAGNLAPMPDQIIISRLDIAVFADSAMPSKQKVEL